MAQYFDTLRKQPPILLSDGSTEAALYESGSVTNHMIDDLPVIRPENDAERSSLQQSGYVPREDGTWTIGIRDMASGMQQRELLKREAREMDYNKTKNSMMFKIGDTLADTGRLFMSPLFWLSGEDTSKYDPSERLKTGYRKQFDESVTHTEGLYGRVQQAQRTRQDYRNRLLDSDRNYRLASNKTGTDQQKLIDFANNSGPENLQLLQDNTSDSFALLQRKMMLATDQAIPLTGINGNQIIVPQNLNQTFETYGKRFDQSAQPLNEAFLAIDRLDAALERGTPLSEVAAITQFNKILDPGSVVRESEVKLTAEARGLYDSLMVRINNIQKGDVLSTSQATELGDLARALGKVYQESYNNLRDDAEFKFRNAGYSDENVTQQYLGSRKRFSDSPDPSTIVIPSPVGGPNPDPDPDLNKYYNAEDEAED